MLVPLRELIERYERLGILRRDSNSHFGHPIHLVAKSSGAIRFTTDLRALNARVKSRKYDLPLIQDL